MTLILSGDMPNTKGSPPNSRYGQRDSGLIVKPLEGLIGIKDIKCLGIIPNWLVPIQLERLGMLNGIGRKLRELLLGFPFGVGLLETWVNYLN